MTKDEALKLALLITELRQAHAGHTNEGPSTFSDAADMLEALAQPEQEPLEYWNAVEGWVKIDEVRQHFETVNCGTIYKTAGEGRVPLYTTPPKRKPLTDQRINEVYQEATCQSLRPQDYKLVREFARAIEAAHGIKEKNND